MNIMYRKLLPLLFIFMTVPGFLHSQGIIDSILPVRGFAIAAPDPDNVENFIRFINEELAPRHVNTLLLRVDFNYQYESHPELRDSNALSKRDVKKIVKACKKNNIEIIPQINLLGHQSWASTPNKLLKVYPEFDETPWVKFPDKYVWPNADGLYCKSYCPLHPGVHKVVFDIVDEICDVFDASAFHAGMDEVFYIGEQRCPRCGGLDKAELFAGEVTLIRNHLAEKNRSLWIWGDRLLDGKTTGLGEWEASYNSTHRAIDMIPKDVVICDWHYETPTPTAAYFALKGFRVITCPWREPGIAIDQLHLMVDLRQHANEQTRDRYLGMMQTVWSGAGSFMNGFYGKLPQAERHEEEGNDQTKTPWNCFRQLYEEIGKLQP